MFSQKPANEKSHPMTKKKLSFNDKKIITQWQKKLTANEKKPFNDKNNLSSNDKKYPIKKKKSYKDKQSSSNGQNKNYYPRTKNNSFTGKE